MENSIVFKCKMCGGDIEPIDKHIGKCLYCKSTMTLPNLEDEKILNLYNRANNLRLKNEFDKSQEVYESILNIDNEQTEAHWGIVLCKYGVEYVDDPRTKLKIPTCHRTRFESIYSDSDFEFVKKKAFGEALDIYEKEAKQINNIQKRILEISNKEKPYDIFICYKETDDTNERTQDSIIAEEIYEKLTSLNYRVFFARITLEDKIGEEYEPYIFSALNSAKVMLVVGTNTKNLESIWVKNEWSRYLEIIKKDKTKVLIPVYSKMNAYELPEDFSMLQAQNMDKVGAIQDLIRGINKIITASGENKYNSIDEEIAKKVQSALDDSRKIDDNRYEVKVLKEKMPSWYILIFTILSFFTFFATVISTEITAMHIFLTNSITEYFKNISSSTYYVSILNFSVPIIGLFIINAILEVIFIIFRLLNSRKFAKASNYILISQIAIQILLIFVLLITELYFPAPTLLALLIIKLIQYFIRPKWEINTTTVILDEERTNKVLENNKKIKDNFTEKDKSILKPQYICIILVILLATYYIIFSVKIKTPQTNARNEEQLQFEVINDLDFYIGYNKKIGNLKKGEIYTILKIAGDEIYIKTGQQLQGHIKVKKDTDTIKYLLPNSNKIDSNKRQLIILNDFINVREKADSTSQKIGVVHKNEIYTILNTVGEWYEIEFSQDKTRMDYFR